MKFKNLKCVSLLHKSELCFFQLCEIEIDVIFVKQDSEMYILKVKKCLFLVKSEYKVHVDMLKQEATVNNH